MSTLRELLDEAWRNEHYLSGQDAMDRGARIALEMALEEVQRERDDAKAFHDAECTRAANYTEALARQLVETQDALQVAQREIGALKDALEHVRWRNHPHSPACSACNAAEKLTWPPPAMRAPASPAATVQGEAKCEYAGGKWEGGRLVGRHGDNCRCHVTGLIENTADCPDCNVTHSASGCYRKRPPTPPTGAPLDTEAEVHSEDCSLFTNPEKGTCDCQGGR